MADYRFRFEEITNKGTVLVDGAIMPKEFKVIYEDKDSVGKERLPTCELLYRVSETEIRCVLASFNSNLIGVPIHSGVFRRIDPEEIGKDIALRISEKRNPGKGLGRIQASSKFSNSRRVTKEELILVAQFYLHGGNHGGRIKAVQEALGYESILKAQRRIRAARDAGLIPPPRSTYQEYSRASADLSRVIAEMDF